MTMNTNGPGRDTVSGDPIENRKYDEVRRALQSVRDCDVGPRIGFTERLMSRIPNGTPTLMAGLLEELTRPGRFGSNSFRLLSGGGTQREFALMLALAGLFHLFLALLTALGLGRLGPVSSGYGWLGFQSAFLGMIGIWLFVVSLTVWKGGRRELKKAGSALWAYMVALLINVGWMAIGPGRAEIGRPYLGLVIGIACFGLLLVACRPEANGTAMKTGEAS